MKKDKYYNKAEHKEEIEKALEEFLLLGGEVEKYPTLYPEEIFGTDKYTESLRAIREYKKERKQLIVDL